MALKDSDLNKTVLEMEIARVKQSSDIITYAINERSNEKLANYEPAKYEGEAGKKLEALLEEGRNNAAEWIEEINQKNKESNQKEIEDEER